MANDPKASLISQCSFVYNVQRLPIARKKNLRVLSMVFKTISKLIPINLNVLFQPLTLPRFQPNFISYCFKMATLFHSYSFSEIERSQGYYHFQLKVEEMPKQTFFVAYLKCLHLLMLLIHKKHNII